MGAFLPRLFTLKRSSQRNAKRADRKRARAAPLNRGDDRSPFQFDRSSFSRGHSPFPFHVCRSIAYSRARFAEPPGSSRWKD
jgi:hypothetical protein